MVSKTRKQRQKRKEAIKANHGQRPVVVPTPAKSVHLKKTRPHMKSKMKIRLGLDSPINVYDNFETKRGVCWMCPLCSTPCRVVGFCVRCASKQVSMNKMKLKGKSMKKMR